MLNYEQINNTNLKERFVQDFYRAYTKMKSYKNCKEITFLCVGTDRITGDCFGPIVGSKLKSLLEDNNYCNINVYGSLDENLNYKNIHGFLKSINRDTGIIIIDAALSKKDNIGKIFISNAKTVLGKGLAKNKVEIGDISIKAVVAKDYKIPTYNFKALQNISLNTVLSIADIVSEGIYDVIKYN